MKPIVVACSAGCDSMALLDTLVKEGKPVVVAHVNYKKRESADRDQAIVEAYCQAHSLACHVCTPVYEKGNFQHWARNVRYDFFEEVADQVGADTVAVAHHMDDVIETYLFQTSTGRLCETFGIAPTTTRHHLTICRPFLRKEKKELETYCQSHHIEYGLDETNLNDAYTRNQIRHEQVEHMSTKEKERILKEIEEANRQLEERRHQAEKILEHQTFSQWKNHPDAWFVLDWFLYTHTKKHYARKYMTDLLKQLNRPVCINVDGYDVEQWQGELLCEKGREIRPVVLDHLEYKDYGIVRIQEHGTTIESVDLKEEDFPVTIRPAQPGDAIRLRQGTKKVSRFFIDRKIPKIRRKYWLVLANRNQEIIFVPGIGCDIRHFSEKANAFVIQ